jgi:foldase protein PrsA
MRLNNRKTKVFAVLIITLALLLSGCGLVQVNEEKDRKIVVAEVNGEDILKGEILDQYHAFYGETEEYDKDIMLQILDSLIEERLVQQKAAAAGYVVDDEMRDKARQDLDETIKNYAETLKEQAGEDADPDTDYELKAREDVMEFITASGRTEEEYIEQMAKYFAIQAYLDEVTVGIEVDDQEVEDYYQEELEFQTENPSLAAYYSSVEIVKEPASRLVKHILIKLSDEDSQAIGELRKEGKDDDADSMREEKLKSIQDKAEDVLAKARAGEDFDKLVIKYGEDPGMESEEYKDGYSMLRDSGMMEEFLEASFQLQEGEISDLVATDYGYHIIKVYEASEDDIASLEDVREELRNLLLSQKKNEKTGELIVQWLDEADVKKYEKRL